VFPFSCVLNQKVFEHGKGGGGGVKMHECVLITKYEVRRQL
jgi:hypothetical protein